MSLGTPPCQRRRTQRPPVLKLSCLSRAQTVAHVAYGAVNLVPCAAKQAVDGMGLSRVRHRLETQGTHTVEIEFLSQRPPRPEALAAGTDLYSVGARAVLCWPCQVVVYSGESQSTSESSGRPPFVWPFY